MDAYMKILGQIQRHYLKETNMAVKQENTDRSEEFAKLKVSLDGADLDACNRFMISVRDEVKDVEKYTFILDYLDHRETHPLKRDRKKEDA